MPRLTRRRGTGAAGWLCRRSSEEDIQHMLDLRQRVQREPRVLTELISALEKLLARVDQKIHASLWAALQVELGNAYRDLPTGDRGANLGRAIACYTAALTVYTPQAAPRRYAATQNNLGTAYSDLPTGDRGQPGARHRLLHGGAEIPHPASRAAGLCHDPEQPGECLSRPPTGDRGANLGRAIACYTATLTVYTPQAAPREYAADPKQPGNRLPEPADGGPGGEPGHGQRLLRGAPTVYTPQDGPREWAIPKTTWGLPTPTLPTGDRGANLARAIACYGSAALPNAEAAPFQYAATQNNLGTAYATCRRGTGGEPGRAIACYTAALPRLHPGGRAPVCGYPEQPGHRLRNLPTGDRGANLERAIACYAAALRSVPRGRALEYATTQNNLGTAYRDLPTGDRGRTWGGPSPAIGSPARPHPEAAPRGTQSPRTTWGTAYETADGGPGREPGAGHRLLPAGAEIPHPASRAAGLCHDPEQTWDCLQRPADGGSGGEPGARHRLLHGGADGLPPRKPRRVSAAVRLAAWGRLCWNWVVGGGLPVLLAASQAAEALYHYAFQPQGQGKIKTRRCLRG